jgi:ATP-dependent Lhr-like helicase
VVKDVDRHERWARQLLRRYGVVFRDLLGREGVAPAWRDLIAQYRRLEARGEIRGGRFITGVAGEQYAAADAVEHLRRVRSQAPSGDWIVLSAADPLNLYGILDSSPRVPAANSNAIVVRDGRLLASRQAGRIAMHQDVEPGLASEIQNALTVGGTRRRDVSPFPKSGVGPERAANAAPPATLPDR